MTDRHVQVMRVNNPPMPPQLTAIALDGRTPAVAAESGLEPFGMNLFDPSRRLGRCFSRAQAHRRRDTVSG
jgi:hypothetical protein